MLSVKEQQRVGQRVDMITEVIRSVCGSPRGIRERVDSETVGGWGLASVNSRYFRGRGSGVVASRIGRSASRKVETKFGGVLGGPHDIVHLTVRADVGVEVLDGGGRGEGTCGS